jgi:uncharacterized membrane protein
MKRGNLPIHWPWVNAKAFLHGIPEAAAFTLIQPQSGLGCALNEILKSVGVRNYLCTKLLQTNFLMDVEGKHGALAGEIFVLARMALG